MCDPPAPVYRYRILYLGMNCVRLIVYLNRALHELACTVVYVPAALVAHALIESHNEYALFLFDEQLAETSGAELAAFARTVRHRARTPCLVVPAGAAPDNSNQMVETIKRLLVAGARA